MSIWSQIKHFSPKENWGDPSKVSGTLLLTLEALRERLNWPIIIHCAYATSGHSPNSYHYKGLAADFHVVSDLSFYYQIGHLLKALAELQLSNFVGLGIYPDWNNSGFHLDVRGYRARWGRIGKQYVSFDDVMEYVKRTKTFTYP